MRTEPLISVIRHSSVVKRPKRNQSNYLPWIVGGGLAIAALGFGLKIVGEQMEAQGERMVKEGDSRVLQNRDPWYDRGYAMGLAQGQRMRNDDDEPDIDYAFAFSAAKHPTEAIYFDGGPKVMPGFELRNELPKRGTNDFGQFRKGFDAGFAAGYVAR